MDIAKGEATEKELDSLIRRLHESRVEAEGERLTRELWQVMAERKDAKDQSCGAWDWVRFFEDQAERAERNGAEIAATNRARAEALRLTLGASVVEESGHKESA